MHSEHSEERAEDLNDEPLKDEAPEDGLDDMDPDETVVMSEDSFSDPDISMEVNVEKLVAQLEKENGNSSSRKAEIRRRLEELAEDGDFEDTYAVDYAEN